MRKMMLTTAAAFAVLATPWAATAQECAAGAAQLPAELAAWSAPQPLTAAKEEAELAGATLEPGKAVDATLIATRDVRYPVRPERPGGSVSYGGLFAFSVESAGTYRVAIGSGAWIDVVQGDGELAQSSNHGPGPQCTGIRKMVDFPLEPGTHTLLIAANGEARLPVLVTRLP